MISPGYIGGQFRAVIAMAQANPKWQDQLDADADGFYRSFWALGLSLPLVVVSMVLVTRLIRQIPEFPQEGGLAMPLLAVAILQIVLTIGTWSASVLMLIVFARGMNAERRISPLVVSYNWSELLNQLVMLVTVGIILLTPDPAFFAVLLIGVFIFSVYIRWGVIRRSLEGNVLQSLGVFIMLYVVAFVVNLIISGLGQGLYSLVSGG